MRTRAGRLTSWTPETPALPPELRDSVEPDDPDWFVRELAIAAAPPWWFWRRLLACGRLLGIVGRIRITGTIPPRLASGPLLVAVNHVGDFDPIVIAVALHRVGLAPRMMATGGIMSAPIAGPLLERSGGIRVNRGTELARHAFRVTEVALAHGGHVVAYPEGRIGLAADGWPERGRTGLARLALAADVPVIPVSQWGAQQVLTYANDRTKLRAFFRALRHRPLVQVHIGPPVFLADLSAGRVGDAHRARMRIAAAITRGLAPLRAHPGAVAWDDPGRPATAVAAFPGGIVPEDVP